MKNPNIAFFPGEASTIAPQVDALTIMLLVLCGFIIILVFGLMLYFSVKYRASRPIDRKWKSPHRERIELEFGWTLIPLFLFFFIFGWGGYVFFEMHEPPKNAAKIYVVAKQWMWKFQHPDGTRELDELHIPVGQPVKLIMTSQDVIHSFFVPEFRVKQDVLPGRYTSLWFQATKTGVFHLFCTQYCGTDHARMTGQIIVMKPADYQQWLASGLAQHKLMGDRGERLFNKLGCIHCHGSRPAVNAPPLARLYGSVVHLRSGETVVADENYIRESILNPDAKIVDGFKALMPPFKGLVSEDDVLALIEYIKSLRQIPPAETGDEEQKK